VGSHRAEALSTDLISISRLIFHSAPIPRPLPPRRGKGSPQVGRFRFHGETHGPAPDFGGGALGAMASSGGWGRRKPSPPGDSQRSGQGSGGGGRGIVETGSDRRNLEGHFFRRERHFRRAEGHFRRREGHFSRRERHFSRCGRHFFWRGSHFPRGRGHFSRREVHLSGRGGHFPRPEGTFRGGRPLSAAGGAEGGRRARSPHIEYSAKSAPWGSRQCAMRPPPGMSAGP